MGKPHKTSGFTLVELVITVAVMLMLISLAMPTFQRLRYGARESEARSNLAAIKICQESYKVESDSYLPCTASPGAIPSSEAIDWADNGGFTTIGFDPGARVRYQYTVTVDDPTVFIATAIGDLDGNSDNATLRVTNRTTIEKLPSNDVF